MTKPAFLRVAAILVAGVLGAASAFAESGGGVINVEIRDRASEQIDALNADMVRRSAALGAPVARAPAEARAGMRFQYPVRMSASAPGFAADAISQHVDHDPTSGVSAIRDFACGSRTYDGHGGTDIIVAPFSWTAMDRREMIVVAAMAGIIVDTRDGEFDRQCTTTGAPANYVVIRHNNGLLGYYFHLKNGTVTRPVGSRVDVGDRLGYVGSSGNSTGPHLHFELRDAGNNVIDPYGGQCNAAKRWTHQARVIDTTIVRLATHSSAPPNAGQCDNPNPNYARRFAPGQQVFGVVYFRDQTPTATAFVEFVRPDGSVASSLTTGAPASMQVSSYWWTSFTLPTNAPGGAWRLRATLAGRVFEEVFWVGALGNHGSTKIGISVQNPQRNVTVGTPALFNVTLNNNSASEAVGCRLSIGRPILADVSFRAEPGDTNAVFRVRPNSSKTAVLRIKPLGGFRAFAAEFAVHAKCWNSDAAPFSRQNAMVTLTGG